MNGVVVVLMPVPRMSKPAELARRGEGGLRVQARGKQREKLQHVLPPRDHEQNVLERIGSVDLSFVIIMLNCDSSNTLVSDTISICTM